MLDATRPLALATGASARSRDGLPARMWVALEACARWPQRSLDGREETAIGLGQPALESLGVGRNSQPRLSRLRPLRADQPEVLELGMGNPPVAALLDGAQLPALNPLA